MKKILSLFVLMLAMVTTAFAAEKTVWEGSEPISWNTEVAPGTQFATPEGTFTGLAKGDIIRAYTTTTYDAPQYVMTYMKGDSWDWTDLETTFSNGVMTYTVADETIATEIATRWIVFRGQAYTLTKITVETPESGGETTGTVIWEGSTTLDWGADPGVSVSLEASKFANAKAGDVLKIEGTADEWIQVQVCVNYPWKSSDSYTALPISYTIAEEDLENIKANGMTIAGQYATITKVTLTTAEEPDPQPAAGETYTAWTGEKVFTSEWSVWEQIPASSFAKAQQDMLLSFRFKDVGAGAQFKVSTAAWADMPDAELVNIDGVYQQYTITAAMLTELQANGCIISGTSFTLISIEVINPADLKPLTLSVPVTGGDWVFENETPTFIIQATNPYEEAVTANAVISIATDKMSPVTTLTKEVEIAAGATENIELSWTEPTPTAGFFKATCTVNDDLARAFFFGVNPTQIVSAPDKQSDFDSFWQTAKDELAAIEATDEPVLTKIESKSTDKRTVYLVEFKSVSDGDGTPVTVRGYYAEPNDGKKHPVIMHYQGYDSGYRPGGQDATPWCFDGDGDELSADYAEFILSTRGQSVNNRPAADRSDGINRDFENTYGDWFAFNFGYKDKYYYRGAYMDCVRAIDFMATRPTSDMTNLYAEGQSQGGAFTYAAAALSGREFKAIAPGIAFMGDFPDYFQIVNWPAYVARECQQALSMSDADMYAFLSYFDTKNLATKISDKVAVIATIGVQDNVCPPHTNIAPYNNLPDGTVKEISFNPENAHQVAANWYDVYMAYFKSKYVEPQPEPEPATPVFDENGIADLSKMEVQDAGKVTYDAETHTVTTTEGWTGVQLTVTDGEEVSGKELRITFDREMAVKCYVKYVDETDADVIMDKAEKILYFTLDETKKLYQVQIQPTDAATFAFEEIKVNQESTKPEPQPVTPVFDENGIADLSKMEVQDAEKVTYDVETHTVTTTEGWTGVQLTVTDGEEVSGKELRITFDREMAVKCYVKYVDETDADVIMDKAEKILYFTLDETKKLYQVQIQPTDAATFAFEEIKVNQESTKPEPQPVTPVFDENGIADLSKMEVQDAGKVTYDVETHTVTTTEGWTGVQLTVTDGEEISGKELRITFDREMAVKCYVKYVDETDADVIMDKAEKILYFTLDETKKLYQVQIQPTDAATFAFEEIKVNQESTKPEPEPEPGEKTRTENAQKLFDLLQSLYGNKMISGTTAYVDWNIKQAEQVNEWTGNYPAINTYDFINLHASKDVNPEGWLDYSDISGVKKWASEGGLVSAMWHWQVKNNAGTGYTCTPGTDDAATSFDASKVYVDGTAENTLAKQQLSQICGYLKQMKDAGIPVIWRPLHEAAGNTYEYNGGTAWFWWGAQGADVYKQLWQWMYNYMVNEQGLTNLIWVWTSQTKDGDWYPGNDYVDIIGRDIYGGQAAQQKSDFDNLTASYPNMMVALSECGNTNDASQSDISTVWETGAKWSWFSTWYDAAGSQLHNTQDWWTNAFSQDYVITRAQMKELLDLNIEPDPEPQPEPTTNTFDENGIADLSKVEVQDAGKVTYDAATHTVTTTEGWTGVQLTVADGEQVSGKELRVTFDRAMRVKCYVKYLDETDADVIMDDAAEILYFELDNTKKLYQIQIQPTEAATFAFDEIRVNAESTKPVLKPLEEGEVRTLFEDEEGVVMAWNEICQMDAEWGAILETGESFLVTVKSRTEGSEWPKVILRDANSEGVIEVGLSEVSSYPYIVKMVLTDDIVTKLRNGFRFSGDGITITKIEISKPAPVKEGDVSIEAMNWFRNATYDAATHTGSTSSRWGQFGWAVGDDRYADMTLVIVTIEETSFPVTLKMEYTNTDGKAMAISMGVAAGKTQLNLPLPLDTKVIKKIYLTYAEAADVVLTDASIIAGANARPLTGYEDDGTTGVEEAIVNALSRTRASYIYYDLQGRRVQVPVKGLYIVNGKKIIK